MKFSWQTGSDFSQIRSVDHRRAAAGKSSCRRGGETASDFISKWLTLYNGAGWKIIVFIYIKYSALFAWCHSKVISGRYSWAQHCSPTAPPPSTDPCFAYAMSRWWQCRCCLNTPQWAADNMKWAIFKLTVMPIFYALFPLTKFLWIK